MNLFFLIIPFLLIGVIPVFAQTEIGLNYDDQLISINPDGSEIHKFTTQPERILINNVYEDSRYTATDNYLTLETGHGSISLNKSTCSFDFYPKGIINGPPLFTDSIVPKIANNGTNNWNEISQISNSSCETYGSDYQLVAKKYSANVGFIEYKYINTGTSFKTHLEATNLSSNTNKKFGFTQTIDLNRDVINWGKSQKNLDNFSNSTFNRSWLESHESKVLNLLNGINFNLDIAFDNLESVYVLDTGLNKSKLSFNYLKDSKVILPNDTLIIDPVFGYTNATSFRATYGNIATCDVGTTEPGSTTGYVGHEPAICHRSAFYWDITLIPDTATITNINLKFNTNVDYQTPVECKFYSYEGTVATDSIAQVHADAGNGTLFLTSSACNGASLTDVIVDLGSSADADLQSELSVDNAWAIGIRATDEINHGGNDYVAIEQARIEVTYLTTSPPYAVTDLTSTAIGQTTATLDWSEPSSLGGGGQYLLGYQVNVTTPQTNTSTTIYTNDTGSATSLINLTGLILGTSYSAKVSAWTNNTYDHPFNNATGNVYNFTTSTFIPPSAPTLSALVESTSSIRFTSINGTTNDKEMFYYGLRCELNNSGGWLTTVSNSTTPDPRIYSYSGLTLGDTVTCQWRDGSSAGFGDYSNNATETTVENLGIIQTQRDADNDKLTQFASWIDSEGGLYFGMGVFPLVIMLIGFMATKGTVRIFTLITLMVMGIIHASGYFVYPTWYWTLAILFGIVLVLGRQARD